MAILTEVATFEANIYQLETTDPVQGGAGGIANIQAQKLGNRTQWLKGKVDALLAGDMQLKDAVNVSANTTLTAIHMGAFITASISSSIVFTLSAFNSSDGLKDGQAVIIKNGSPGHRYAVVTTDDTQFDNTNGGIASGGHTNNVLDLYPGDTAIIIYRQNASNPALAGTHHVLLIQGKQVPVSTVIMSASGSVPVGYLECDGAAVSRTTYYDLFQSIGTTYGSGNGTSTFNIPDLRGEFIRGWDHSRGVDASRAFGSTQADDLKSHYHIMKKYNRNSGSGSGIFAMDDHGTDGSENTETTGGSETRPRNVALMYLIKY
jgi:microcystin-dependent protein